MRLSHLVKKPRFSSSSSSQTFHAQQLNHYNLFKSQKKEREMVHMKSSSLMLTSAKMHNRGETYVNLRCVQLLHDNAQIQTPNYIAFPYGHIPTHTLKRVTHQCSLNHWNVLYVKQFAEPDHTPAINHVNPGNMCPSYPGDRWCLSCTDWVSREDVVGIS